MAASHKLSGPDITSDILTPAWIDEDEELTNSAVNHKNNEYSTKLKNNFVTLMGTPRWAKLGVTKKKESEDEDGEQILRTVGHLQKIKPNSLKKEFLEVKRLPKINPSNLDQGILQCIVFHPKASAVLLGGRNGVTSLFSVGGDKCNKLHIFKLQKFSVASCYFTPSGTEAYMSSFFGRDYCIYDLVNAAPKIVSLPGFLKTAKVFVMSPNGKYLAISDDLDEVYFICALSQELLRVLKHNSNVQAITFSSNSEKLYCYGVNGEISVWDLSIYRIQQKIYDNGCITASRIKISPCGRYLATGSGEGIVNIYETANLNTSHPFPLHIIKNLQTKITEINFNSSSEILGIASSICPNAIKLVHIPSYHVFQNFPNQTTGLDKIMCMNFSPNSGYMALGTGKTALLYRLKHFENY